ncbi:hypothetical protein IV203_012132 [Nitzschia inconspicua]|uniref:Uncharacterized protein n=1 Tax=Nitzschia inconspicua TaxID=303405 RepID=A0A9K3KTC9_9STRA|nr:hypothetical protein IV203_012132 [Nitzschia inconspicua]
MVKKNAAEGDGKDGGTKTMKKKPPQLVKEGMFGAAFMATKAHKVAAPIALYLIRNGARFQCPDDFYYLNIHSFFREGQEDLEIAGDEEGFVLYNSSVANYLRCHEEL